MSIQIGSKKQFEKLANETPWEDLPKSTDKELIEKLDLPHGVRLCPTGLVLPKELTNTQWQELGKRLATTTSGIQWALGDWWAYGHNKAYGQRWEFAKKHFPFEHGTLMNWASVARAIKPSLRSEALTFSHYAIVASLSEELRTETIAKAINNKWSVKHLREHVAKRDADIPPPSGIPIWAHNLLENARKAKDARESAQWEDIPIEEDNFLTKLIDISFEVSEAWQEIGDNLKQHKTKRIIPRERLPKNYVSQRASPG